MELSPIPYSSLLRVAQAKNARRIKRKVCLPSHVVLVEPTRVMPIVHTYSNTIANLSVVFDSRVTNYRNADGIVISRPLFQPKYVRQLKRTTINFIKQFNLDHSSFFPLRYETFLANAPGGKTKLYKAAMLSLYREGIKIEDSKVNFQVKYGKLKPLDIPRAFGARNPRYNLELGCYTTVVEKHLYYCLDSSLHPSSHPCHGIPAIHKALNAVDSAKAISAVWNSFSDPVAIGIDVSRYDYHLTQTHLQFEHKVILSCFKNDPHLAKLLSWQNITRVNCTTKDNYTVKGNLEARRISGDMTTSLGNILFMCLALKNFADYTKAIFGVIDQGDDVVLIIEQRELNRFKKKLLSYMKNIGLTIRVEFEARCMERIRFCQASPVQVTPGNWVMVREPSKSIANDSIMLHYDGKAESYKEWRKSVSLCGLAICAQVPVLSSFYTYLGRGCNLFIRKEQVLRKFRESGLYWASKGLKKSPIQITECGRNSYYLAFGTTPNEQVDLEEYYQRLDINDIISHNPKSWLESAYVDNTPIYHQLSTVNDKIK